MDTTSIIDDIPVSDGALATLTSEAQKRGQTLNEYLLDVLDTAAERVRKSPSR